ncbi:hypothetical protein [Consotaella aegiceratis]|uniref:hypothetical protein n=1 Tax=Consotaella aegiceratis TaxID=3097961 RepID=UPI002F4189AC
MTSTTSDHPTTDRRMMLSSPLVLLAVVVVVLAVLLALPLTVPIGPQYWDLFIYFDAANRIFDGQFPSVDFFAPVGPLGYWLFALLIEIFPRAQPLFLVQWSLLVVTAPLMALILLDVDRRSRSVALALLVPFLIFSILPVNIEEYSHFPSVDGYGIYNRQTVHLLYVLTAALALVRGKKTLLMVVAVCALALFLGKITGFVAAMILCLFAFAVGRLALSVAFGAALVFLAGLGALEALTGVVSAYVRDILALVFLNEGELLPRFVQAASIHFGVFASGCLLVLALLLMRPQRPASPASPPPSAFVRVQTFLDGDACWLAVVLFAALFFETQNTGGQAFIFIWPVLLVVLIHATRFHGRGLVVIFSLVAATVLPTTVDILHRSARAFIGQIKYEKLANQHLKTLGAVNQRSEFMAHARTMLDVYQRFPQTYQYIADQGELPGFTLYTDPDFQITWLMAVDQAVDAILGYEADHAVRFETIMNLNFVNPFPWLLDRHAPRLVAIGADPYRAVPPPSDAVLAEVARTDLVLYPKCPITGANIALRTIYQAGLEGHQRVALSPCWDGYIRTGLRSADRPAGDTAPVQ